MERYDRAITISIKIVDDKILCIDGQPLPKLSNNTVGELVIPSIFLKGIEDRYKYGREEKKLVFMPGQELFFEMNPKFIASNKMNNSNFIKIGDKYLIKILIE